MISYDGLRTRALTEMGKGIKSKGKTDETQERYNTIPSHNKQVSLTRGNECDVKITEVKFQKYSILKI